MWEESKRSLLWAFNLLAAGVGGLVGLGYLWHLAGLNPNGDAAMAAVCTIFPMMATPYIISIAMICAGVSGFYEFLKSTVLSADRTDSKGVLSS